MLILHNQVHRCCFLLQFMLDCFFSFLFLLPSYQILFNYPSVSFHHLIFSCFSSELTSFPFLWSNMWKEWDRVYKRNIYTSSGPFFADEINRIYEKKLNLTSRKCCRMLITYILSAVLVTDFSFIFWEFSGLLWAVLKLGIKICSESIDLFSNTYSRTVPTSARRPEASSVAINFQEGGGICPPISTYVDTRLPVAI